MAIVNSVRNVLPGFGTSGLRGGTASGASPQTVSVPMGMNKGYVRVKGGTTFAGAVITATDGTTTETIASVALTAANAVELMAPFISDLNLISFTCTGAGLTDFEVWGNP